MTGRTTGIAASIVLLAAGLAGCADDPAPPLHFAEPALWTSAEVGMDAVAGATIHDDRVVLVGASRGPGDRLAVLDADTGDPVWTLDSGQQLWGEGVPYDGYQSFLSPMEEPVLTGSGPDWSIVIPYQREIDDEVEVGMAALSGETGKVRWQHPVTTVEDVNDAGDVLPLVATDDTVWITLADRNGDVADVPVTALDAKDGTELWNRKLPGLPHLADGDTVLAVAAEQYSEGGPGNSSWDAPTTAMAFDARSGETRWDMSGDVPSSTIAAAAGGIAVVSVGDETDTRAEVIAVDTRTGEQFADLGDGVGLCETDGTTGIVCDLTFRMATIDLADRSVTTADDVKVDDSVTFDIDGIHGGQIFVNSSLTDPDPKRYVIDPDGTVLGTGLPGDLVAIDDTIALFRTGDGGSDKSVVGGYAVVTA